MSAQDKDQRSGRSWLLVALPLIFFLVLAGIFYKQLAAGGATSQLPSALIGRKAPGPQMQPLAGLTNGSDAVPTFSAETYAGKYSIVNVWASWCAPCRQEHPLLVELGKRDDVQILGLNYKDKSDNALRFLGQLGNPYDAVGVDPNGRAAIDWGVYGIPESFVVGPDGTILHKHVGPLTPRDIVETIVPMIEGKVDGGAS